MICQDFDQLFYPILNAVRISQDFDQLSDVHVPKHHMSHVFNNRYIVQTLLCNFISVPSRSIIILQRRYGTL